MFDKIAPLFVYCIICTFIGIAIGRNLEVSVVHAQDTSEKAPVVYDGSNYFDMIPPEDCCLVCCPPKDWECKECERVTIDLGAGQETYYYKCHKCIKPLKQDKKKEKK